jgi:hypothetical protein
MLARVTGQAGPLARRRYLPDLASRWMGRDPRHHTQSLRTAGDALRRQIFGDRRPVERLDPQAQVIEVDPAGARCAASRPGLVGRHDVDQRVAGTKLGQFCPLAFQTSGPAHRAP